MIYTKLRGNELADAVRTELANAQEIEGQRAAVNAAVKAGGPEAWSDFLAGWRADESGLCAVLPILDALGKDPLQVNRLGEGVIAYALRYGYLKLAQTAMRNGLPIPTLIDGKIPIGVWSKERPASITEFVEQILLPQLLHQIQKRTASQGMPEAVLAMVRGETLKPKDLARVLAKIGAKVSTTSINYVLFLDGTESARETIHSESALHRRISQLALARIDHETDHLT